MQIQWKTMKSYNNIEKHGQPLLRPSIPKESFEKTIAPACMELKLQANWTTIRCSYGSHP